MMPRSLFILVAAALSVGTGCAASDAPFEDTEESADELNGGLRHITIMKGSMSESGSITVAYEPNAYAPTRHVPFLAIELTPGEATARSEETGTVGGGVRPMNGQTGTELTINVAGDFPGSPRVLVTDENFRVLAATRGVPTEAGAQASVVLPNHTGKKLVLVRDMLWVTPMTFEVSVGRPQ